MYTNKVLQWSIVLFSLICGEFAHSATAKCPDTQSESNVFDATSIYKDSHIAIEKGNGVYPVTLAIYRPIDGKCQRGEFARYSIEGSVPTVDSLFFVKLQGQVNVFTIVSWSINNKGDGTYGKLYQIYAYKTGPDGSLLENKNVSENEAMTGIDGYDGGLQSSFLYRTAADVKRFLRNKVNEGD